MAGLVDKLVELPFTKGLDTKTDGHLVAKPTTLKNLVFRGGKLKPRYGTAALGSTDDFGSGVASASGLATFKDALLRAGVLSAGAHKVHSYSSALGKWTQAQSVSPFATATRKPVLWTPTSSGAFDHATAGGVTVVAWADSVGQTVRACAYDEATGAFFIKETLLSSAAAALTRPKVVVTGSGTAIHVYWLDEAGGNTNLVGASLTVASPISFAPLGTLKNDAHRNFDAVSTGTAAAIVYDNTGTGYTLIQVSSSGVVSGATSRVETLIASSILVLARDGSGNLFVLFSNGSNSTTVNVHASNFSLTTAGLVISATVSSVAGAMVPRSGTADVVVFWTHSAGDTVNEATVTTVAVTVASVSVLRNARIISAGIPLLTTAHPAMVAVKFVAASGGSLLQPGAFVMAKGGSLVARLLPGTYDNAGVGVELGRLPGALTSGTTISLLFRELSTDAGGISRVDLGLVALAQLPRVTIGDALFIGGAKPLSFDGSALVEWGFQQFPEGLSDGGSSGAGALSAGTYQWAAIYEWVDARGRLWRSAPSAPLSVAGVGAATGRIIAVPTLHMTDKTVTSNKVNIFLYRTEAGGTVFYRASDATANDPTVNTVNITDSAVPDSTLIAREPLYSQAANGVLEAIAAPACKYAWAHGQRLMLAGLENPLEIRYSTEDDGTDAVRFNEVLSIVVPADHGAIAAGASMDGKNVIWCQRGIWAFAGSGPNETGLQNTFTEPQDLLAGVGCDDWRSVVELPGRGLAFRTAAGLRLLRRDLVVDPGWGLEMDAYAGAVLLGQAQLVEQQGQVRWFIRQASADLMLVYDYVYDQWSVVEAAPGTHGVDAVLYGGLWTKAVDAATYQESSSTYADAAVGVISFLVETEWVKTAGIQGFQRVRRVLFLGKALSSFAGTVSVGYDDDETYAGADTFSVDPALFSVGSPLQFRHHLRKQKCETIRFKVQLDQLASTDGAAEWTALSLECGVKRGGYKGLSSTKSI